MTGSAKSSLMLADLNIDIFIRSVNHKYLDIKFSSNKNIKEYEENFSKIFYEYIKRGHIDCFIECKENDQSSFLFDEKKILFLVNKYENLTKKHKFFNKLINFYDIISLCENNSLDKFNEQKIKELSNLLIIVIEKLHDSRLKEGKNLIKPIGDLLYKICENTDFIKKSSDNNIIEKITYLKTKMLEILKNESNIIEEQRLYQEAALLAQKSDFTEEIDRLFAHIKHFDEVCMGQQIKGRKLDFICQEMLREVNTLLSKASNSEIIKVAIETKAYVENLREQIQNIE